MEYFDQFLFVGFFNVLCKIHIPNLAKDFQSETNMPSIKVHQCRDIYPKLSVLKQHDQIFKLKKKCIL